MGVGDVTANISKITGKGLNFDGVNDDMTIIYADTLDTPTELTIAVWLRPDSHAVNDMPLGKNEAFLFSWDFGKLKPELYIDGAYRSGIVASAATIIRWYHAAVTYNSSERVIKTYLDGALVKSTPLTGLASYDINVNANDILLGREPWGAGLRYTGKADDLRIYKRALTTTEIENLYNSESVHRKNLSLHMTFENTSNLGEDTSGNGNNGTNNGTTSTGGHNTTEDDVIASRVNANSKYGFVPLTSGQEIMSIHIEEA